eukprot:TRINITY_DN8085_c0_g1_i1.p1 TRINITY_DN8085_c0_g1~~TRINITY_DN8085_c0_g1_i1.p1  ORF type:complete len:104 (-),score=31.33 TRINITY_DN8085_c0_g1_i1:57-368(-)
MFRAITPRSFSAVSRPMFVRSYANAGYGHAMGTKKDANIQQSSSQQNDGVEMKEEQAPQFNNKDSRPNNTAEEKEIRKNAKGERKGMDKGDQDSVRAFSEGCD